MPSLLQRQIFKEIANLFVLAVGVLLTLILISRAVQMRELFLGLDLGILDTVLLFGYMTPLFLMLVIPIACMLSVFLTFLRMSTDRELVALRAGGINIYQMLPRAASVQRDLHAADALGFPALAGVGHGAFPGNDP